VTSFIEQYRINKKLCDRIVEYGKGRPVTPGRVGNSVLDKDKKESLDATFDPTDQIFKDYVSELHHCLVKYSNKYSKKYDVFPELVLKEPTGIQFYPPGGGYKVFHCELDRNRHPGSKRILVFMTYLNDVYIGGQTEFPYQKKSFRPRKGKTLIWPADWTHIHRGKVAPFEEKTIVTGWIHINS